MVASQCVSFFEFDVLADGTSLLPGLYRAYCVSLADKTAPQVLAQADAFTLSSSDIGAELACTSSVLNVGEAYSITVRYARACAQWVRRVTVFAERRCTHIFCRRDRIA